MGLGYMYKRRKKKESGLESVGPLEITIFNESRNSVMSKLGNSSRV